MNLTEVKKQKVGSLVEDLDVNIITASKTEKAKDGEGWEQRVRVADTMDNIWCLVKMPRNTPLIRNNNVKINSATISTFENKEGTKEKRLDVVDFEVPTCTADEYLEEKEKVQKNQGILNPMIAKILEKYGIAATEALWAFKRGNVTTWIILHRYCEQIAAKAHITFDKPELIYGGQDSDEVLILVTGYLGYIREWSYGEASPTNNKNPYPYAMAEKRAKDRVILKLAGIHGMVYSEAEEDWNGENK